jgi:hypothetical protein
MRIGRLEFGIAIGPASWGIHQGHCYCVLIDLGKFYVTWMGYECLAATYKEKARLYRAKRYLKTRKERPTRPCPSKTSL